MTMWLACGFVLTSLAATHAQEKKPAPVVSANHAANMAAGTELFKSQVRGLLTQHCLECHGGKSVKADFDLSTREALLASGAIEKAAQSSHLYRVVAHLDEPFMPHKRPKLKESEIAVIAKWIELGAPYDKPLVDKPGQVAKRTNIEITADDRNYWAFRPLKAPSVPTVKNTAWPRNDIDRFLLAKMESQGIEPVGDAAIPTLIRRLYFDLIGLPPTVEELKEWETKLKAESGKLGDNASNRDSAAFSSQLSAFSSQLSALVRSLLARPQHGERWARHWLDPARFGESHGFEHDYDRKFAYFYRDYVIRAFNNDQRYDEFVRWQIAGDEIKPDDPWALAATGFLGAGVYPTQITTSEAERIRYDAMDDMLATTGHTMLGLTIGCARCHDHKYDPIPSRDYYQLLSAFTTTVRSEVDWDFGTDDEKRAMAEFEARLKPHVDARNTREQKAIPVEIGKWIEAHKSDTAALTKIADQKVRDQLQVLADGKKTFDKLDKKSQELLINWYKPQDAEWKQLNAEVAKLEKERPKETRTKIQVCTEGMKPMRHHVADGSIPDFYADTYFLTRGDTAQKGDKASPGFLQVLMNRSQGAQAWSIAKPTESRTSLRRTALANWLTDVDGGAGALAARVIVNRVWHHHFGRGIVATINDLGLQAEPPTHPELLEWLAADFVAHGWQLKRLHEQIVTSRAWGLGGKAESGKLKAEGRGPTSVPELNTYAYFPRRRLEAEAIRDNLLAMSGELDPTMYGPGTLNEGMNRRSIYFQIKRSQLIPMLQVFDWPDTLTSAGARPTTIVAPQALLFLNNPHVHRWSQGFAKRLLPAAQKSPTEAVDLAFKTAFGRSPTKSESSEGMQFIAEQQKARGSLDRALADYALVLMSLNEFVYVD
jgi:mono/diheme cytochrome c family protein